MQSTLSRLFFRCGSVRYESIRHKQPRVSALAGLIILFLVFVEPAFATEPTSPINIITPEDSARSGKFTTDQIEVVFREKELAGFKPQLILFKNGEPVDRLAIELRPKRIKNKYEDSSQELSVAKINAVPDEFLKRAEPGVYAHKIRIEANMRDGSGSLIEEKWIRWRTDGKRVELLDIERYSALLEKTEMTTDDSGKPISVLIGRDVKVAERADSTMEKPSAQLGGDGVLLERPVELSKQELESSLDESKED